MTCSAKMATPPKMAIEDGQAPTANNTVAIYDKW
jgi:hypothetical protein